MTLGVITGSGDLLELRSGVDSVDGDVGERGGGVGGGVSRRRRPKEISVM